VADVTITTDEPGEGEQAGVAAGMALATATAAAEDAEVAVAAAEDAQASAAAAAIGVTEAADVAYDARADVASLREDFTAFMTRVEAAVAERQAPPEVVEVTEPAPEPAKPAETKEPKGDNDDKPKQKPYGNATWFGHR
jgi:hypothetical protein